MKVLFLEHLFPLPLDSGGKLKSYHTLKGLAAAHEVHLLSFVRTPQEQDSVEDLRGEVASMETVPLHRSRAQGLVDAASALATGRSFIISRDYRPEMARAVNTALESLRPDVVHIDHLQMAQYVSTSIAAAAVLDQHNVEFEILRRLSQTANGAAVRFFATLEWPKLKRWELKACAASDLVVTVSEEDAATLREACPSLNVRSAPIAVDTDYFSPVEHDPNSRNLLSIGTMYWPPNVDSMLYFHREIFPLVRREMPECTLTIAGQRPVRSILNLASDPAVTVTGYLDDVRRPAANCGVFIVPLRSGSGVRVKILSALAMALPVVSTSVGAEGLEVESGRHLLVADTPADFARCVIDLLRDPSRAAALGAAGRELVCSKYSGETVGEHWRQLYKELETRRAGS